MSMLPNSGTFSYNGVSWVSLYRSKVEVKPQKDSAGRALVTRDYTVEVEGRVVADVTGSTDLTMEQMRTLLEKPAGVLIYKDKGFGDLSVNVPGGQVWDASYGPWPEVLAWDPIGNDQSAAVRWRCTTQIPCEEDPRLRGIIEYCWEESWDVDEDGYTTRTITGHLVVQATRQKVDSRRLPDNADAYRDQVIPDLPPGFRRKQSFKLSEDKRTLEFHFVDEEMPAPLPDGVSTANVTQRDKWTAPGQGVKLLLTSTISGEIRLPARADKKAAWDKIFLILRSRWPIGGGRIVNVKTVQGDNIKMSPLFLLKGIEIEDEIFGRSTRFSATALVIPPGDKASLVLPSPALLLATTGLWTPIAGTSFVTWKPSIFQPTGSGKAFAPRGIAGMTFQNGDDAIVDLCSHANPPRIAQTAPGQSRTRQAQLPRLPNGQNVDPDTTWLRYVLRLRLIEDDRIGRHKLLTGSKTTKDVPRLNDFFVQTPTSPGLTPTPGLGGPLSPGNTLEKTTTQGPGATTTTPDVLQRVSAPNYTIRLEGFATRINYAIPTPRLKSVGGVDATQLRQDVSQEQVSSIAGVPIYSASFILDYALPDDPGNVLPMPENPAMQ